MPAATRRLRPAPPAPRRGKLREDAVAIYRNGILDAAERVFSRADFSAARMAEIAEAAGLATGTLYNYFDSKEQVFQALVELRTGELLAELRLLARRERDSRLRLVAIVRASLRYLEEHRALFAVFAQLGATTEWSVKRAGGEPAERAYAAHFAIYEAAIRSAVRAGVLRRDVAPRLQTILLTGAMNGLIRDWLVRHDRSMLAHGAHDLVNLLLDGMGRR